MQEATFLILTALAGGSQHGYGIITDVEQISDQRVRLRAGTLYTALERLSADGLIEVDREEIVVGGELPPLEGDFADTEAGRADRAAAAAGRISRFRETTRDERIEIARQAEHRYQRKVAWGARLGEQVELFTVASVPVMTRLRQPERIVLDTLVDSGVARSRSDALSWAVRLVGQHADEWLNELREAMAKVDDLRAKGPTGEGA